MTVNDSPRWVPDPDRPGRMVSPFFGVPYSELQARDEARLGLLESVRGYARAHGVSLVRACELCSVDHGSLFVDYQL